MKCKQPGPGFELRLPISFSTMITVTLNVPPNFISYGGTVPELNNLHIE